MIEWCGASVAGPRHVAAGLPGQDAFCAGVAEGAFYCALADGLGSEEHSDAGALVATEAAAAHVAAGLSKAPTKEALMSLVRSSFEAAWSAVRAESKSRSWDVSQMDCTLVVAILINGTVWWGSVGDSGLVCCNHDGSYSLLTNLQRDGEGRVYPLCFDGMWEFGRMDRVSSIALATDGVLWDLFVPPALGGALDAHALRPFLHLGIGAEGTDALSGELEAFLRELPESIANDDRTLVVAFDKDRLPREQPDGYYDKPDWCEVWHEMRAQLYPIPLSEPIGAGGGRADESDSIADCVLQYADDPDGEACKDHLDPAASPSETVIDPLDLVQSIGTLASAIVNEVMDSIARGMGDEAARPGEQIHLSPRDLKRLMEHPIDLEEYLND